MCIRDSKKRDSIREIEERHEILKEIREEPQLYKLWDNYLAENRYIGALDFAVVLDTLEEVSKLLDFKAE